MRPTAMPTNYLYGDSSAAPLTANYIELLRDALTFSVEHLLADQQRHGLGKKGLGLRGACDAEVRRIEELSRIVARGMEGAPVGSDGSIAAATAQAVVRAADEQVRLGMEAARTALGVELGRLGELENTERSRSLRALEQLLLHHDIPDTNFSLQLTQAAGVRYVGRVSTTAGLGLDAMLELEIMPGAQLALAPIARVERFVAGLDLHAPESGGWLRKETRMKPQRVDKLHVVELAIGEGGSFKLRVGADGTGPGFDVAISTKNSLKATYTNERGEMTSFDPPAEDTAKIADLFAKLVEAATEARFSRKRLVSATLDGDPFIEHEEPTVLVERLVEEMAPVVQEIARRSKSTEELIIKRVTGDKRREEIFISKAELVAKLAVLPPQLRMIFSALGLEEPRPSNRPPPTPKTPSRRPPPIPEIDRIESDATAAPTLEVLARSAMVYTDDLGEPPSTEGGHSTARGLAPASAADVPQDFDPPPPSSKPESS